jgi:hypothetical protein
MPTPSAPIGETLEQRHLLPGGEGQDEGGRFTDSYSAIQLTVAHLQARAPFRP